MPSISAFPDISKVAASSSPVKVIFLKPVISLLASTITTFDAVTVPAVMPSVLTLSILFIVASTSAIEPSVRVPSISALLSIVTVPED